MRMSQSFQQDLTLAGVLIFVLKMKTVYRTTNEIKLKCKVTEVGEFDAYDVLIFWSAK